MRLPAKSNIVQNHLQISKGHKFIKMFARGSILTRIVASCEARRLDPLLGLAIKIKVFDS